MDGADTGRAVRSTDRMLRFVVCGGTAFVVMCTDSGQITACNDKNSRDATN